MYKYSPTKLRDEVTPDIAEGIYNDYRLSINRHGDTPSAKTLYHFLTDVCAYWDWEVALRDKVLFNPFSHIDKPSQDEFTVCTEIWNQNEFNKVYEELEFPEDKEAFLIARYTGMYPKDIFLLKHEDVVNKGGVFAIYVRRSKSTSKRQLIRLPVSKAAPEIAELVLAKLKVLNHGQRLFCRHYNEDKFKLWGELFGKRVAAAWKRAFPNQPHKTPKALRHTRTTEWLEMGHEPDEIGAWLGHVDGSKMVLSIYAHRKAMRQLAEASARPLAALPPGQNKIAWNPLAG
jgi:integrase